MLLIFLIYIIFAQLTLAGTVHFTLVITKEHVNPDCHNASYFVPLVNGQYPGPELRVNKNDYVVVDVVNGMDNDTTTVHFHGIRQYDTFESDGVPYVTQAPIPPRGTYQLRFHVINQAGTFLYHAHVGLQEASATGAFIVDDPDEFSHDPRYNYDDERTLQLTQWWHSDNDQLLERGLTNLGDWQSVPYSILMNGMGVYDSSHASSSCQGFGTVQVEPNKTYRLRIIGGQTFFYLGLAITGHPFTIIEVDGEAVEPYQVDSLEIGAAQRFSVLIHTKSDISEGAQFLIATQYRLHAPDFGLTPNGYGFLQYSSHPVTQQQTSIDGYSVPDGFFPDFMTDWIWQKLKPLAPRNPVVDAPADATVKIRSAARARPDGSVRFYTNGVPPPEEGQMAQSSIMSALGIPIAPYLTFRLRERKVIDIVLQNVVINDNMDCIGHAWHTHGHSHYILATGDGEYLHERDGDIRNYPHPVYKDVSTTYPGEIESGFNSTVTYGDLPGCGWTKLRIYTDNPGRWAVHCHMNIHMVLGKMVVLDVKRGVSEILEGVMDAASFVGGLLQGIIEDIAHIGGY